eukprot:1140536-Pelagomonas_calceolata.AAC.5
MEGGGLHGRAEGEHRIMNCAPCVVHGTMWRAPVCGEGSAECKEKKWAGKERGEGLGVGGTGADRQATTTKMM